MRQAHLKHIEEWYLSERRFLDDLYKTLDERYAAAVYDLNSKLSVDPSLIPPPPRPALCFKLGASVPKSEDTIGKITTAFCALDYFVETDDDPRMYNTFFTPRFSAEEKLIYLTRLTCKCEIIDLVWSFYMLWHDQVIVCDLKTILPQHFQKQDGSPLNADTIEKSLKRIRDKKYKPDLTLAQVITSALKK